MQKNIGRRKKKNTLTLKAQYLADFQKIHPYLRTHVAFFLERFAVILASISSIISIIFLTQSFLSLKRIPFLTPFSSPPSITLCLLLISICIVLVVQRLKNIIITGFIYFLSGISFVLSILCLLSISSFFQQHFYPLLKWFSITQIYYFFHIPPNAAIIFIALSLGLLFIQ